jgi:lipopolysaccharide transport system permease protein
MVQYRDFRFIVPFIVQFGLYISPVGFQTSIVPEKFRLLYGFNPMVGIIDGFRWCLLGPRSSIYLPGLIISIIEVILFVVTGIWYFRKTERTFADVI